MSTYGSESFYRATIRQSLDNTTTTPITLKVSKTPTLTKGLLTISPNTSNEELVEYDGKDDSALTITIVKRGISHSTQSLSVDGTDYNNPTYQRSHSQNDAIRGDVNHLHIIQDYGNLQSQIDGKVNIIGGVRTDMGTAQNIGATNGSTSITVVDTTGWSNGASITGIGIPTSTTIVSFVPNTSAVLSNGFTGVTGTVSVIVGRRQVTEIDSNNNEVKKLISNGTTISSLETIRKRKSDGTYEEVPFSFFESAVASLAGGVSTFTGYDSNIVDGNLVGNVNGFLTKCVTENESSINLSGSSITLLRQVQLDLTRTMFLYNNSNTVTAVVGTVSGSTYALGTPITVFSGSAVNNISAVLIGNDKVAIVYGESTSGVAVRARIATVVSNVITLGTELSQLLNNGYIGNYTLGLMEVQKIRTDVFVWSIRDISGSRNYIAAYTVSGTTITAGTVYVDARPTGAGSWGGCSISVPYLSDNIIAYHVYFGTLGVGAVGIHILTINPASTAISGDIVYNPGTAQEAYLSRLDNTRVLLTYFSANTNIYVYGTTTSGSVFMDNGASKFLPMYNIADNIFCTIDSNIMRIYQYATLIRTIALPVVPPSLYNIIQFFAPVNGRLTYLSGTNGTIRLVNLGITFYLGIAINNTGGVMFRGLKTNTNKNGVTYYVSLSGTMTEENTGKFVGVGLGTSLIVG